MYIPVLAQKAVIVAVGNKADVLRVLLIRVGQSRSGSLGTDVRLVKLAYRQQQVRKLPLRELIEHVALVLAVVFSAQQAVKTARFVMLHARIVPRGNAVIAHLQRAVQKRAEFQLTVAVDAGIRRPACAVFGHKFVHHAAGEAL